MIADAGEDGGEVEDDVAAPDQKRRRVTRKVTAKIFVDFDEMVVDKAICRLGCLNKEGNDRLTYSITSTTSIERHVEAKLPSLHSKFKKAQNNEFNIEALEKEIENEDIRVREKLSKLRQHSDRFFRRVAKGCFPFPLNISLT